MNKEHKTPSASITVNVELNSLRRFKFELNEFYRENERTFAICREELAFPGDKTPGEIQALEDRADLHSWTELRLKNLIRHADWLDGILPLATPDPSAGENPFQ